MLLRADVVDALSLFALPLLLDDVSSDAWLPASGGTQSEPLSTVPSGQLPGESAPFAPPPQPARPAMPTRPTKPAAQNAPALTRNSLAFRSLMPRMIALLATD